MQKIAIIAATSLFALSLAMPVHAAPFTCGAEVTAVEAGTETVYLVDTGEGYVNGWIYLEGNGVEGLQRGGTGALDDTPIFIHADTECESGNPDVIIY